MNKFIVWLTKRLEAKVDKKFAALDEPSKTQAAMYAKLKDSK